MTKVRKQKRKKKFRANVNRKRLRNKLQKLPKIECEDIESSWELKRSIRTNLRDMGLAYDPNEALKIPSTRAGIKKARKNIVENEEEVEEDETPAETGRDKIHVANKLEADAKAPRERMFRLPKSQVQFVTYLMHKYGDDYKAMARDRKNHYQMTWCQIRAKINTFKSIPEQYAEYLLKSGEIVLDDPETLEETRRKIGEENAKKYCVARKRKIVKEPKKPIWDMESEGEEVVAETEGRSSVDDDGAKKLKLFSEDEESEDEDERKSKKKKEKPDESLEKLKKKMKIVEKAASSDSDDESGLEGDDDAEGFVNLSELSEEELSEDDVLDDGEFVSDSE